MTQATLEQPQTRRALSRGRLGLLASREIALIAAGLVAYRMVRYWVKDQAFEAFGNAHRVIGWEKALGIFNEVDFQSTILSNHTIIFALNRYYFIAHFLGMALLLTWLFTRHRHFYGRVRRVLFAVTIGGLALHVAFPLAPPRWFPEFGFVDTLQTYGPRVYDSATVTSTVNQIAAMPSLHVAWALITAWAIITTLRSRWRWIAVAHPIVMALTVVVTANHWWLDAAVASLLVVTASQADRPLQNILSERTRRREEARLNPMITPQEPPTTATTATQL